MGSMGYNWPHKIMGTGPTKEGQRRDIARIQALIKRQQDEIKYLRTHQKPVPKARIESIQRQIQSEREQIAHLREKMKWLK